MNVASRFCQYDHALLAEKQPDAAAWPNGFKCPECRREYKIEYPSSATGSEYLVEVYNPKWDDTS